MCGRFVAASPSTQIARYFDAELLSEQLLEPNFNVAPTDDVPVVVAHGDTRRLAAFHWGLVPFWAKDPSVGSRMINARAEGVTEKAAFRHAFRERRCLVPADGFYEWKRVSGQKKKQPYYLYRPNGEPLAMAGLREQWRRPRHERATPDEALRSCTIVTTDANELVGALHDRMPVILPASAWEEWLDPENDDIESLERLLAPAPAGELTLHPVGPEVSDVRNSGAGLIKAVEPDEPGQVAIQGTLL
jgi:putative SOS response-associated peptidase YedK